MPYRFSAVIHRTVNNPLCDCVLAAHFISVIVLFACFQYLASSTFYFTPTCGVFRLLPTAVHNLVFSFKSLRLSDRVTSDKSTKTKVSEVPRTAVLTIQMLNTVTLTILVD
jgi:hypothetical protein